MTTYQVALSIDFGEVGYGKNTESFCVSLDAAPLARLIAHAERAHRVYELMLIDRPGDVWDYVWVVGQKLPSGVAHRIDSARKAATPRFGGEHPWPGDRLPFVDFDRMFRWVGDDTEPADSAWLGHRNTPAMHTFAQHLMATVRSAQSRLDWSDHLLRHDVSRVRAGTHPFGYLERRAAIEACRDHEPNVPVHTAAFYKQLRDLLRHPDLASVAYRANGDHDVLRMMTTEQRRRANLTGHPVGNALHLSALVNKRVNNEAWDSEIWFFDEGLAHGDLFIEGGGLGGGNLKALVETHHRVPGRFILSTRDEGDIAGFDAESGDGWVLYRKQVPDTRRRGLERIADRRKGDLGPVLSFDGQGATLFEQDKTVVVVGDDVSTAVRSALAASMAEWQQNGGDPTILVLGDTRPFELAGCRDLLQPATGDPRAAAQWFASVLRRARPWTDAIVALNAPEWSLPVLADIAGHRDGPWLPWVVATVGTSAPTAHQTLDGDLAQILEAAHHRARAMRPQRL